MKKISTCLIALSLAASALAAGNYTNGIYLVNEDWFGHNSSTVNFYSYDADTIAYRVYQAANAANGYTLGNTTQYAALAGGNMYFCSKQNYGTTGGRLDVADAKTLVRKASISTIGSADTRAFLSITASKAYVGTNKGIYTFDKSTNTVGPAIAGITGEVGNMVLVGNKVLAASNDKISVIDAVADALVKTVAVSSLTTVFAVGGQAYAAANSSTWGAPGSSSTEHFLKLDATTCEPTDTLAVAMATQNTWFAWKNSNPAIDEQHQVLYYSPYEGCNFISKYDLASGTFTQQFITFDGSQQMYGNVVAFDPASGYIVAETFEGYSSQNYYLNIYKTDGTQVKSIKLASNYWFPSMVLFSPKEQVSTGVASTTAAGQVASVKYFNLQGMASDEPFDGINIKVITYTDGTKQSLKMVK